LHGRTQKNHEKLTLDCMSQGRALLVIALTCKLQSGYQRFGGIYRLCLQGVYPKDKERYLTSIIVVFLLHLLVSIRWNNQVY